MNEIVWSCRGNDAYRRVRGFAAIGLPLWLVMVVGAILLLCFFFQAEDGIRDRDVTGVQTCALPICGFVLDSVGPLGLGLRRERIALPWEVAVYPPLVTVRLQASLARAQRRREQGNTPLRRLGEGRLFESLRDWVPGDDLRHIDWKATGRRGKVITRQFEAERRQHVLLVLDLGRLLTAEIAGGVSRLEYVVRAALELAYAAVSTTTTWA